MTPPDSVEKPVVCPKCKSEAGTFDICGYPDACPYKRTPMSSSTDPAFALYNAFRCACKHGTLLSHCTGCALERIHAHDSELAERVRREEREAIEAVLLDYGGYTVDKLIRLLDIDYLKRARGEGTK